MAEPARAGADGGESPGRKPDPRASGWSGAQQAMAIAARACGLAVTELASRPGEEAALEMARLCRGVLENLGDTLRRLAFDEAVMAEERAAGYREGYEACKAQRCRLQVVDGG
jgi:predicted component of type VI protein secretion system